MNTIQVMRMLQQLNGGGRGPTPALMPINRNGGGYDEHEERPRSRKRSPSPPSKSRGRSRKESPPPRKEKRRARSPSSSSEETEAYGSPSESDYSSYDEPEEVKKRFAKEPCEYVSPAGLSSRKTKKEVVNYLEEKQCPKIETHAKKRKHVSPGSTSAPAPSNPSPPVPQSNSAAAVPPPPPAVKDEPVKKMGRPKKPVDPNAKPKKPPTEYNLAVGRHRKAGLSFADAAKAAKAELAEKKKTQ